MREKMHGKIVNSFETFNCGMRIFYEKYPHPREKITYTFHLIEQP